MILSSRLKIVIIFIPTLSNNITGENLADNLLILGVVAIIAMVAVFTLSFTSPAPAGEFKKLLSPSTSVTDRQPACSDSDGGWNIYEMGTCRDMLYEVITGSYTDYCIIGTDALVEYFCHNERGSCVAIGIDCTYGCSNGACLDQSNDTTPPVIEVFTLEYNDTGDYIYFYALASDYESGMSYVEYSFRDPTGYGSGAGQNCIGNTCTVSVSIYNPEPPGNWTFNVSFTNNVYLTVEDSRIVYVPA